MKQFIVSTGLACLMVVGVGVVIAEPAAAINVFDGCTGNAQTEVCKSTGNDSAQELSRAVITTLLFALGIIAVIMIIVGGIRYTTSNGDAGKIKSAKDTVLYSVVGLVVAMLAYAIVNFVIVAF